MADRTNEQWLADLTDADSLDSALEDLRTVLLRGLRASMANRSSNVEANLEDFVQEALLKILDGMATFRGESKFTTWGQKIAVRVALTELRRLRWRDTSLDEMIEGPDASTETIWIFSFSCTPNQISRVPSPWAFINRGGRMSRLFCRHVQLHCLSPVRPSKVISSHW